MKKILSLIMSFVMLISGLVLFLPLPMRHPIHKNLRTKDFRTAM